MKYFHAFAWKTVFITGRKSYFIGLTCMILSGVGLALADYKLQQKYKQLNSSIRSLQAAQRGELEYRANEKILKDGTALLQKSEGRRLLFSDWNEQRFSLNQSQMTRASFNLLMKDISNSSTRIFLQQQFSVSAKQADYGLFDQPEGTAPDLVVSLNGRLRFFAGAEK